MPPKKKKGDEDEDPNMKVARFGRVKNTLAMGFGEPTTRAFCFAACHLANSFFICRFFLIPIIIFSVFPISFPRFFFLFRYILI